MCTDLGKARERPHEVGLAEAGTQPCWAVPGPAHMLDLCYRKASVRHNRLCGHPGAVGGVELRNCSRNDGGSDRQGEGTRWRGDTFWKLKLPDLLVGWMQRRKTRRCQGDQA